MASILLRVIGGLWLVWLVYWLLLAGGGKTATKTESGLSQLAYGLPIWLSVWLMWGGGLPIAFLQRRIVPETAAVLVVGTTLVVLGLGFAVWARRHLGANWSGPVSIVQDHQLIVSGPYRFVRHPIYSGILVAALGTALAVGRVRAGAALVLCFVGLWLKLTHEERWLQEAFGPAYAEYQETVAALIPLVL